MKRLLAFGLMIFSGSISAQQCPPGTIGSGCLPPNDPRSPHADSYDKQPAAAPSVVWENRWGAIATDAFAPSVGTVEGMKSKRKAEAAALAACRGKGGKNCEVDLAYFNQCAVMLVGEKTYIVQGAASVEEATGVGMKKCTTSNGTACRLYYSACSMAERIQ